MHRIWQGAQRASDDGWRRRLNWSYWDLATDFPITRPLVIALRIFTLCVAVPAGAFLLAGLVVSMAGSHLEPTLFFGGAFLFVGLAAGFSFWDLRRLIRRAPHARDSEVAP